MTPLKRLLTGSVTPMPLYDPVSFTVFFAGKAFFFSIPAVLFYAGTTLVTSWALKALQPKIDTSGTRGLLTNNLDGTAPQQYVYGQVRKGGTITFYEATGTDNKYLHMVICLAGHEVEEIGSIYVNDKVVTLDGSGFVTSDPWKSKIRIKKHLGADSQTVDTDLESETSATSAFRGRGIAYLYARLEYDQDVFANGIPTITAVVKGKKVYDPRTLTTGWSRNAALCVRDYLTDARGLGDTSIDDTMLSVAANVCDEAVALVGGGSEVRYAMNGVVSSDSTPNDILHNMMTACAGTLFWGQGAWKLKPAYYTPPVKTFTLADLRSNITLQTRSSMADIFNAVQGTFNDAAQDWITADYPKIASATFVTEDGGIESALDFEMPMTTSSATAQRIAKLTLFRGREQMTFSAEFGLAALEVQVGDIVAITNPRYGWTDKEFEVTSWKFFTSSENNDLRVAMSLRETSEAAFDWAAEESALLANNSALPSAWDVPPIGITVESEMRVSFEKLTNVIKVTTTATSGIFIERVETQFRQTGETEWRTLGVGAVGSFEAVDIDDGYYDVRARAYNQFGVRGEWTYRNGFQVAGLAIPPQDVTGFVAEVNGDSINLSWSAVTDLDLSYYIIRHAKETTGATWSGSVTYVEKVARPSTEASVPAKAGTYLIKAVDKTGVQSVNATAVVVSADEVTARATVVTIDEDPAFSGVMDNVVLQDGEIRLGNVALFDSLSGNIDSLSGQWDALGVSYTVTDGTYYFANIIDRTVAEQGFVTVDMVTRRFDTTGGLWDDLAGSLDLLPGLWDDLTGGADFNDTNVTAYVSTTNDDPAGSPTWSDWRKIRAANVYGRALKFKIELHSDAPGVSPAISELSATGNYA